MNVHDTILPATDPELSDAQAAELFAHARELGNRRPLITASPNVINGACMSRPICRHCKWETIKLKDPDFASQRTLEEFLLRGRRLDEAGVNRIFIPSGWMGYQLPQVYGHYVQALRKEVRAEIWGLMGSVNQESLAMLRDNGMDGYICGLESPKGEVYRMFRPGGDSLEDRLATLGAARKVGLKIWSGFLVGLGENSADRNKGIAMLCDLEPDSVSILPFTPSPGTAWERKTILRPWDWALIVAKARLALPEANHFSDQPSGFLEPWARLAGTNGLYVFPAFEAGKRA